ncbi:MAG: NAD-dependent epimerase/dehydratase family protein [Bryobacteraceae bacterium]|jgi:dihydroflavonol-4-reductase
MRVFVTGATGLLGSNIVNAFLTAGHAVKALARTPAKTAGLYVSGDVTVVQGDLGAIGGFAGQLAGCDLLVHAAAYFREYYAPGDHWDRLYRTNVDGTREILSAAADHGVAKVVYISTSGLIGPPASGNVSDETTPPGRRTHQNLYFRSKLLAEEAITEWSRTHATPVMHILPGWMFGPGDTGPTGSGRMVLDFLARKLPAIAPGHASVVDARDVAAAVVRAAERGRSGERYIVAGRPATLREIVETLARVSGIPAPRLRLPYFAMLGFAYVSKFVGRVTGAPVLVTPEAIRTLQENYDVSSAKAERELGATFRPLEETLRDEIAWFRQRQVH